MEALVGAAAPDADAACAVGARITVRAAAAPTAVSHFEWGMTVLTWGSVSPWGGGGGGAGGGRRHLREEAGTPIWR
nr:hypothetical protein KPHV_78480 [Kitasatospora purpeofusca]